MVPASHTFWGLHVAIQDAMGWEELPVDYVTGRGGAMEYVYDFGDHWQHGVFFEGYERAEEGAAEPACLAGAGACPPEDVGGTGGYRELLAAMADPAHPEHEEYREWIGGDFDPEEFAPEDVWFDDPGERWRMAFEEER